MSLDAVTDRGWRTMVVAATGPSLTETVAKQCMGYRLIAVNDAYRRLPFADVLYAGDADWWDLHKGCPDFLGEKWSAHEEKLNDKSAVAARYGLRLVQGPRQVDAPGFCLDNRRIHYGNSSGFQAINLALHFGATLIFLVGFDMRTPGPGEPRHFFGDHAEPGMNLSKYEHFLPAFQAAAQMLPNYIRIVNCTPRSAMRCFPMGELKEKV